MAFEETKRQDLIAPCAKGCPDRNQFCRDSCTKPEFLAWRALKERQKADEEYRRDAKYIDRKRIARNKRVWQHINKGGG